MILDLEGISVDVHEEAHGIRAIASSCHTILPDQTVEHAARLIEINYKLVRAHYEQRAGGTINATDISDLSLKIVFHYLFMYNLWRGIYPKEKERDLRFLEADFDHPQTHDTIVSYFRTRDTEGYRKKCAQLLEMDEAVFIAYETSRNEFHNMR